MRVPRCCIARNCGRVVRRDDAESIYGELAHEPAVGGAAARVLVTFTVPIPANFSGDEIEKFLAGQGYTRIHARTKTHVEVVQDRLKFEPENRARISEAIEAALKVGNGQVTVRLAEDASTAFKFSSHLHCASCDLAYDDCIPNTFSFNSPVGACEQCRGFGRTIGIDYRLVIPDEDKTLAGGAIKPWQTKSNQECQSDLLRYAKQRGIPVDVPWRELSRAQRAWVIDGEGTWRQRKWYGVAGFFAWLESKAYKMHVRVLLSKYRSYDACPVCSGARLKPTSLNWRLGTLADAAAIVEPARRFRGHLPALDDAAFAALPGLSIHDLMMLPAERTLAFFERVELPRPLDDAAELVLGEIRTRLRYLCDVGLKYLTLDRQARTLSGGEVQRINLTTALGTSLVNTLFVLDEPSVGLHPRDLGRIVDVLAKLRDAGNTLLVVEHDAQVMLAADRIVDMGPGPGRAGGAVVFNGTPRDLVASGDSATARQPQTTASASLTGKYLRGELVVGAGRAARAVAATDARLVIRGAREHNLRGVDAAIPLNRLVCVTGVSGSGKSTLIEDVLYNALLATFGKPKDAPGAHDGIEGFDTLADVVLVDQAPIGRTTRSNPASFVGVLEPIRQLFAAEPLARERRYTAATFSFNTGNGRCPECSGLGFEHVEMQFLSDVYLRCAECNGRRYRSEVLDVKLALGRNAAKSIADVLDMTVAEAIDYFAGHAGVRERLQPLVDVGLEYLTLGQAVPTLSGGEAQRLKLAAELAEAPIRAPTAASAQGRAASGASTGRPGTTKGRTLFLFDEPTTGLHFADVAKLVTALDRLVAAGHSVVVVEHNLDVIAASDWLIDLGPEGGDLGGAIVAEGPPSAVRAAGVGHTAVALAQYEDARASVAGTPPTQRGGTHPAVVREAKRRSGAHERSDGVADAETSKGRGKAEPPSPATRPNAIEIWGAREHNLRNVDLAIPRDKLTVITGVSGSGKSTVAFDILFAEGQRRYLESLNAYARQFVEPAGRADVDAVYGIPPTVAIEQRTSRGGRKSSVATLTEVYHFLRLLFVKLGVQHCPDCGVPIDAQSLEAIHAKVMKRYRGKRVVLLAPLVIARKGYYTELAEWSANRGYAALRVDGVLTPTAAWPRLDRFKVHDIELPVAELAVSPKAGPELEVALAEAVKLGRNMVRVLEAGTDDGELFSTERACPSCSRSFEPLDPRLFSYNSKYGWCPECFGTGVELAGFDAEQSGEESEWEDAEARACSACAGRRLKPDALAVRFHGETIAEVTARSIADSLAYFGGLQLEARERDIARDVMPELVGRLGFLDLVGLGYLTLDRAAPTLSGGEAQRIRLAAQLGSNLRGVCYILDEPTIGLHPRDNALLLATIEKLAAKGNTVVVVEHDEDTIRRAQHVVDLGPGAGRNGGEVVVNGSLADLIANERSVTGRMLAAPPRHPFAQRRTTRKRADDVAWLRLEGVTRNNLRRLDVELPLARLVCVTGVSGSGKSTLIRDVLEDNLARLVVARRGQVPKLTHLEALMGWQGLGRVLEVDQTPIGKTPRSCPATYVGIFDEIRKLFAATPEARLRGYDASRFSFNAAGGRCEGCDGQGLKKIEMSFLPDVRVDCERCAGLRFNAETLAVQFRGTSIGDVLAMSVDSAQAFFAAQPKIHHPLTLLRDVGLGYLALGQPSPTLSGGEAQRLKLVTELAKVRPESLRARPSAPTLYVLDEPTIGLHIADVEKLVRVLHRLVDAGNSVIVIEHNLDVLAEADWIVDLGPEGGDRGGRVVAQGTPEKVARGRSHTARALAAFLGARRPPGPASGTGTPP